MPLHVELRDEEQKCLAVFGETEYELSRVLPDYSNRRYPMLRYIDEYGDTYFNRLQAKEVVKELGQLLNEVSNDASKSAIRALQAIAEQAADGIHLYLVFIGD